MIGCLWTNPVSAESDGFRVMRAELVQRDDAWLLNADIDYRFSDTVIDALRNGVALTLELRLIVLRDRSWLWDETLLDRRRRFQIRYHSLAKLFQLNPEEGDTPRNFSSLHALLENLGALRGLVVAPAARLPADARFRAKLMVKLDIEALPLPLRPVAYLTPAWRLDSPWYRWSFVR